MFRSIPIEMCHISKLSLFFSHDQLRLRQEADIRRTTLEEEHLSLGTRRVVASQNLTAAQNAHDTLARQLADNETYVQLNNMEKKVCIERIY